MTDAMRELHKFVERKIKNLLEDEFDWPRGIVTAVTPNLRTVSATLDGEREAGTTSPTLDTESCSHDSRNSVLGRCWKCGVRA